MNSSRIVAIVGRPNVGKSRLFNRLARKRLAIVHDQPGVTRDVQAAEIDNDYQLLDTGGIGLEAKATEKQIYAAVEEQVFISVAAAQLILFVVDGKAGLSPLDYDILDRLRKAGKPLVLVVNKIDNEEELAAMDDFQTLGISPVVGVSAEHGRGEEILRGWISTLLGPKPEIPAQPEPRRIKIAFVGRPNVGKSSLCNALLEDARLIVSEVPGTTRDAVELDLDFQSEKGAVWPFRLVDTAGLRRITRIRQPVEYFSTKRTEEAIAQADMVFLVVDAAEGITKQEQSIAGHIQEHGKLHAILINKWDLAQKSWKEGNIQYHEHFADYKKSFEEAVRKELFFIAESPILFVSALSGFKMESILKLARRVDQQAEQHLPTGRVNALLEKLFARRDPRLIKGRRFKIYYATQVGRRPYRFKCFCNQSGRLDDSYRRYLEKGFIDAFDLQGCPLRFDLVGKPARK